MHGVYLGWLWMGVFSVLFAEAVIYVLWKMDKRASESEKSAINVEPIRKAYDQEKDGCPRIARKGVLWH